MKSVQKGTARAGGGGTGSEGCHDAKVISTNVQLEGTALFFIGERTREKGESHIIRNLELTGAVVVPGRHP
jgi:hypothetical protein